MAPHDARAAIHAGLNIVADVRHINVLWPPKLLEKRGHTRKAALAAANFTKPTLSNAMGRTHFAGNEHPQAARISPEFGVVAAGALPRQKRGAVVGPIKRIKLQTGRARPIPPTAVHFGIAPFVVWNEPGPSSFIITGIISV